ncbi:hypothetical protein D3273_02060 [Lichenibacterium minor]|uniref:Uncharacterized protein n=1 Tax=Lichenibacterium minor TaxID=2316528 RepID=A0A4Q2UFP5_9HYPH|nr:hypothetical protein [Lichenibacterium minor]RYC34057.1 hypothetical protein D3273_02060 [Lichenibacterium minor]
MESSRNIFISLFSLSTLLGGCGLSVPTLHEPYEEADVDDAMSYRIQKSIYCELRKAVSLYGPKKIYRYGKIEDSIPNDWAAQETLQLQVDETGSLNANIAYNQTLRTASLPFKGQDQIKVPQSFSLPVGATASSQATRNEKLLFLYDLGQFKMPIDVEKDSSCRQPGGPPYKDLDRHGSSLLFGDLGIGDWLKSALAAYNSLPTSYSLDKSQTKYNAFSYEVKFIVTTTGTVNPMWKLVTISTGGGANPLISESRMRTHDLLITIGPTQESKTPRGFAIGRVPSQAALNLHFTGEIQQAISAGFRSALAPIQ